MQSYYVKLESAVSETFRCVRAANSLDIDPKAKSIHELSITADLDSPFSIGLIVGSSGSGKTTLAKHIWGQDCFKEYLKLDLPVIDQFPKEMNYDECATVLSGIGLTSVPCWIRPAYTLSNGQRARAEAALAISHISDSIVIDEWTSVVDRNVAKVMSHCIQKLARRTNKRIILLSCHYDVIEWLNPDWIVDCNEQRFIDRRLLQPGERVRKERLSFDVAEGTGEAWRFFRKYHYLTGAALGGRIYHFGLWREGTQIGYSCLVNYVPWSDKSKPMIMHVSRTVIHPDYAGMGLGIHLHTEIARYAKKKWNYRIMTKFSSIPLFKMISKHPEWRYLKTDRQIGKTKGGNMDRINYGRQGKSNGFRENVKTWSFEYIG